MVDCFLWKFVYEWAASHISFVHSRKLLQYVLPRLEIYLPSGADSIDNGLIRSAVSSATDSTNSLIIGFGTIQNKVWGYQYISRVARVYSKYVHLHESLRTSSWPWDSLGSFSTFEVHACVFVSLNLFCWVWRGDWHTTEMNDSVIEMCITDVNTAYEYVPCFG